jgi:anti-anti-sigma factor
MSGSELVIEHDGDGETDVLVVRGELDLTNADALEAEVLRTQRPTVVLDLSKLVFVDSAGIRAIDSAHRQLGDEARALLVVAPPESRAAWTFRVAGFDGRVVVDSLDAAAERARGHEPR